MQQQKDLGALSVYLDPSTSIYLQVPLPTLPYFITLLYFTLLIYLLTFVSQLGKPRLRYRKARSAPPSVIHWEFWDWSFGFLKYSRMELD